MANMINDPAALAIRAFEMSESKAREAEKAFSAFLFYVSAIVNDPDRGLPMVFEWAENSNKRKDVAKSLRDLLFGEVSMPKAKENILGFRNARATLARQHRACAQAIECLAGIHRASGNTGCSPYWDGEQFLFPVCWFVSQHDAITRVMVNGKSVKPINGTFYVPLTNTTSSHLARWEDEEGNERVVAFRVTRSALAKLGLPKAEARQKEDGSRNEASAPKSAKPSEAITALHSSFASCDYLISSDAADAWIELIRAWRDADPRNRKLLLELATEASDSDDESESAVA